MGERKTTAFDDMLDDDDDDDESERETNISWSDVIFIPFNQVFSLVIMICAFVKSIMGPIKAISPVMHCATLLYHEIPSDGYFVLLHYAKKLYRFCDPLYFLDTFLRIIHKQVEDKAKQRVHLPKTTSTILLDVLALVPFLQLMSKSEGCEIIRVWPNILAFNELLLIYRVIEYFSLKKTHSTPKYIIGFVIIFFIILNAITCFWILLTHQGFCSNCSKNLSDWRYAVISTIELFEIEAAKCYYIYITVGCYFASIFLQTIMNTIKPLTLPELLLVNVITIMSYSLLVFLVLPKLFAEGILRMKNEFKYTKHVSKVLEDIRRKTTDLKLLTIVQNHYHILWTKRKGITHLSELSDNLPKYLITDIKEDLVWHIFYHSPTLRRTSVAFKRWICDYVKFELKMPGEKFYSSIDWHGNMYYIKSGIVQLISYDDSITPYLSVTSGTLFGDIHFYVPAQKSKVIVRCLTYSEVMIITRESIFEGLKRFPADKRLVMRQVNSKIRHAQKLFKLKRFVRGVDRSEDENMYWLKQRWWQILQTIREAQRNAKTLIDVVSFEIPPEESIYHCSKYIGQLVLCTREQLQSKSVFVNGKFPWILVSDSSFLLVWHRIVKATVYLVLLIIAPTLIQTEVPSWIQMLDSWVNFVYLFDIIITLITAPSYLEDNFEDFTLVIFAQFKKATIILDILCSPLCDQLVVLCGLEQYSSAFKFNRLLKVYKLFITTDVTRSDVTDDPTVKIIQRKSVLKLSFICIVGFLMFTLGFNAINGHTALFCMTAEKNSNYDVILVLVQFMREGSIRNCLPRSTVVIILLFLIRLVSFIISNQIQAKVIGTFYLRYKSLINYQLLIGQVKKNYAAFHLHKILWKRLEKYFICHWVSYSGLDIMTTDRVHAEPHDIYWRVHGETAEKLYKDCPIFAGANKKMIKELIHKSRFLIYPKNAIIYLVGSKFDKVAWIVNGFIKCEYFTKEGTEVTKILKKGDMVPAISIFFGKASLRTYQTVTDCEVLFVKIQDFFNILKRYPDEWELYMTPVQELKSFYHTICRELADTMPTGYQMRLRQRIYQIEVENLKNDFKIKSKNRPFKFWIHPKSRCFQYWIIFRLLTVYTSIIAASLRVGPGVDHTTLLLNVEHACSVLTCVDMIVKMFLAHYDERGLVISAPRERILHYLSHTFILDFIGVFPWPAIMGFIVPRALSQCQRFLVRACSKFVHMYIHFGYFNYIAIWPFSNLTYLMLLKWYIMSFLSGYILAFYLTIQCVDIEWDYDLSVGYTVSKLQFLNDTCWYEQEGFGRPSLEGRQLTRVELIAIYEESLLVALHSKMLLSLSRFRIENVKIKLFVFVILAYAFIHWLIRMYCIGLLVLYSRGMSSYLDNIMQLKSFLRVERIDKQFIENAATQFKYLWRRTKGVHEESVVLDRTADAIRQDVSYFLFKGTLSKMDAHLQIGHNMKWALASHTTELYFLNRQDVMRENDIVTYIYIVHRGSVVVHQNNRRISTLYQGSIFGQLDSPKLRPIKVTVTTNDITDILAIRLDHFHDIISTKVKDRLSKERSFSSDYISVVSSEGEDPNQSLKYILRGSKVIRYPWNKNIIELKKHVYYQYWFIFAWLVVPALSASLSGMVVLNMNMSNKIYFVRCLMILDTCYFMNFLTNYMYSLKLVVKRKSVIYRSEKLNKLYRPGFYIDVLTIIVPLLTGIHGSWMYQLARLLRLRYFVYYYKQFCTHVEEYTKPFILFWLCILLTIHALCCLWIKIACESSEPIYFVESLPERLFHLIDVNEWTISKYRSKGCEVLIRYYEFTNKTFTNYKIKTKHFYGDYIITLSQIIQTRSPLSFTNDYGTIGNMYALAVRTLTIMSLYVIDILITSKAISLVYVKIRNYYRYETSVVNLISYLRAEALSPTLRKTVRTYTNQLWERNKGNWLPELVVTAHQCLKQDIMCTLYIHHLRKSYFRDIPEPFLRQLCSHFKRVVIFPGKCIVRAGDHLQRLYFIHEGDVEKRYVNKRGETTTTYLLTTNGYFGMLPTMRQDSHFACSYYTRTVVDFVYLHVTDWEELLEYYDDVRVILDNIARSTRNEL